MTAIRLGAVLLAIVLVPDCSAAPGQTPPAKVREHAQAEEFVGPFPSWTNVRTAYGAAGDGVQDDTAAIQRALDALAASGRSPVLFFPAGAYRITRTVTWRSGLDVSIVGADPETTSIVWDGRAGGTMLDVNGLAYSRVERLTFDGGGAPRSPWSRRGTTSARTSTPATSTPTIASSTSSTAFAAAFWITGSRKQASSARSSSATRRQASRWATSTRSTCGSGIRCSITVRRA